TAPNKEAVIAERIALLDLDTPSPVRYLSWLGGVAGCAVGKCDLGLAWSTNQPVSELLASALIVTLKLVAAATVLAIVVGVLVGAVSALRQYEGFDYGIIFLSFLLYSLPTFWVAVLLKQWVAIGFNDFLRAATISPLAIAAISLVVGIVFSSAAGGHWRRRLLALGASSVVVAAVLASISATKWLPDPTLGPVVLLASGRCPACATGARCSPLSRPPSSAPRCGSRCRSSSAPRTGASSRGSRSARSSRAS